MNFKRGQAAMEYLMTYGWAILVIVIVLAALLYLGIFNLNPPEVCTMPAGMTCPKAYLSASGANLSVTLVNGLQKTIVVTGIAATKANMTHVRDCGTAANGALCTASAAASVDMALGQSNGFVLKLYDETGTAITSFTQGDGFSGKINVRYYFKDEGAGAVRTISGNIYAKAA